MKKLLFSLFASLTLATASQAQTLDETTKYINHHFLMGAYDIAEQISVDKYGGVVIVIEKTRLVFNLEDVNIKGLNTKEEDIHLLISCADGSKCIYYEDPFGEVILYFNLEQEVKKVAKAFAHLKTLTKAIDPFGD